MTGIRERLDNITNLLLERQRNTFDQPDAGPRQFAATSSRPSPHSEISLATRNTRLSVEVDNSDFPVMVIQRQSMMNVLNLNPYTGSWLCDLERDSANTEGSPRSTSRMFILQPERMTQALTSFSERVHCWFPILSNDFSETLAASLSGRDRNQSETCLIMTVLAIGSLTQGDSLTASLRLRPDELYYEEARAVLPDVISEHTLEALQSLVLQSVYFLCRLKPCHAHDYCIMASSKVQNMLKSSACMNEPNQAEAIRRAYWVILLIESELSTQLDLPSSGIWRYDEGTLLPGGSQLWQHPDSRLSAGSCRQSSPSHTAGPTQSYFLAEIAMRRMLQRCTTSVSQCAGGRLQYAPVIAAELELQLNEWYGFLPELLQFHGTSDETNSTGSSPESTFLQTQYFACKASIYWPAVYQATSEDSLHPQLLDYCDRFFSSYKSFILSAIESLQCCWPNTWTLYAR